MRVLNKTRSSVLSDFNTITFTGVRTAQAVGDILLQLLSSQLYYIGQGMLKLKNRAVVSNQCPINQISCD